MKYLLSIVLLTTLFHFTAPSLFAAGSDSAGYGAVSCQPIYGGGTSCTNGNLQIDKKVQHPTNGTMVDTLGVNDPKYTPEQVVTFTIKITNKTSGIVRHAKVYDFFPQYLTYQSGTGAYESEKNTLSFPLPDMQPGASQTYTVTGKVANQVNLPTNQGVTCITNKAQVRVDTIVTEDTAEFCVQTTVQTGTKGGIIPTTTKGGLQVYSAPTVANTKKSPATGPEMFYLLGALPAGLFGQFLRKKATI